MGWLDRLQDSLGLGDGTAARQYTRTGAAAGLPGMLAGYIAGRIQDNRTNNANVDAAQGSQQGNLDAFGNRLDAATNWGVDLGDPTSAGVRAGPPANLAGGGPLLSSGQGPVVNDGSAPAWYDDTAMNADDPMGLVPDYGQDGPAGGRGTSPGARRDGNGWGANSGISAMQVGGQNVIVGQDPNQMYTRRLVDFGG